MIKRFMKSGAIALMMVVFATFTVSCEKEDIKTPETPETPDKPVVKPVSDSLKIKAGRMLIVGMGGKELNPDNGIINDIQKFGVGGVVLFANNIGTQEQATKLCSDLQALCKYDLMIGVDQEGGQVRRMRPENGYQDLPSHAHFGSKNDEAYSRSYFAPTAKMLGEIGMNTNYAPCVDVNVNPQCPVIGKLDRSFSSDPQIVSRQAGYFIDEHRKHKVYTTLKHFPGHGSSVADTHNGIADITNTWGDNELIPYRNLIKDNMCDIIMVGHIFNSRIDPDYPASLSHATVTGLLRTQLKWNGLVITDDLGMKAIDDHYTLSETVCLCINAGVDMLMVASGQAHSKTEEVVNIIIKLVQEGKVSEDRINESYKRIKKLYN